MARGRLKAAIQEWAANRAKPATHAPASVPANNAQTNGIDLRKVLRIHCPRRIDSQK
jgi:hypothetical protein